METEITKTLTQEEFETLRDNSLELGTIAGLVESFRDRNTESVKVGVTRLLRQYHYMKYQDMEAYLAKWTK
jgi:hypothetical protein